MLWDDRLQYSNALLLLFNDFLWISQMLKEILNHLVAFSASQPGWEFTKLLDWLEKKIKILRKNTQQKQQQKKKRNIHLWFHFHCTPKDFQCSDKVIYWKISRWNGVDISLAFKMKKCLINCQWAQHLAFKIKKNLENHQQTQHLTSEQF